MSKKFFSLISGDAVHAAKKTKIIKADEFSKLADAEEILIRTKEDAKKYHLQIAQECEVLKEKAQKEGFEEGFKKWSDHVAQLEQEILRVRQELEKFLVPVALKAAKKIVGREIELSEDTIVDIVSTSLKTVSQHKKIIIYANKMEFVLKFSINNEKLIFRIYQQIFIISNKYFFVNAANDRPLTLCTIIAKRL